MVKAVWDGLKMISNDKNSGDEKTPDSVLESVKRVQKAVEKTRELIEKTKQVGRDAEKEKRGTVPEKGSARRSLDS